MLTDDELLKRLAARCDEKDPQYNVLLKRNPLILQKKKFLNVHDFYQQAALNVVEVANQLEIAQ